MGADIYLKTLAGREVAYFRDSYNHLGLFSILNATTGKEDLSWFEIPHEEQMTCMWLGEAETKIKQSLQNALNARVWKRGNGAFLTDSEKFVEIQRAMHLIQMIEEGQRNDRVLTWSV